MGEKQQKPYEMEEHAPISIWPLHNPIIYFIDSILKNYYKFKVPTYNNQQK